ncbi:MAG: holo-ACP synthase [Proteobacteria bacterium]|jgi:holo-[acyl-carrier protein] synthase|nr:holo-ACP synthase [Pseudomonadota bacterium]
MRVIGLGNDMVDIRRIEKSIGRFNDRFIKRVFCPLEIEYCASKGNNAACFAKRFAAKEACAKALGTGIDKGVYWHDMCVSNDNNGKPSIQLSGGALTLMKKITPVGMNFQIDLSLSDDYPWAQAIVLITAIGQYD